MRRETTRASRSLRRESRSGGGRRRRTQRLIHRAACRRAKAAARPGGALAKVWTSSEAEVLAYIDVDLSTDLNALLPLVAPAWLLPAASRFCPAQSPGTAATAHTRRTPSHEY